MRACTAIVLLLFLSAAGCDAGDCLPEPASDATPPGATLTVTYTDAAGRGQTLSLSEQDSTRTVDARTTGRVQARYEGTDGEGLRRLQLNATIQETVGVGVQRRALTPAPVTASCPRRTLEGTWTAPPSGQRRDLILSASAENWTGARALTPNLIVRLFRP